MINKQTTIHDKFERIPHFVRNDKLVGSWKGRSGDLHRISAENINIYTNRRFSLNLL